VTSKPLATPTKVQPTKKIEPTKVIAQNVTPPTANSAKGGKTYTVVAGDTLWGIAEKFYKSGYNWVDIAKVNNISNPSIISAGNKLTIPDVPAKMATVQGAEQQNTSFGPTIAGTTYRVQKGDHLWGIAVRAYNDGYKWVDIARVNNITTPNVIYTNMVLKIPRVAPPVQK
jgi:nucleoid-associated protein YgaU